MNVRVLAERKPRRQPVSMQQPKYGNAAGGRHQYLAIGDNRNNELVSRADLITAAGRLIAVIELFRQVGRGVCVQHRGRGVLVRPGDAVGGTVCRYYREGSGR